MKSGNFQNSEIARFLKIAKQEYFLRTISSYLHYNNVELPMQLIAVDTVAGHRNVVNDFGAQLNRSCSAGVADRHEHFDRNIAVGICRMDASLDGVGSRRGQWTHDVLRSCERVSHRLHQIQH